MLYWVLVGEACITVLWSVLRVSTIVGEDSTVLSDAGL